MAPPGGVNTELFRKNAKKELLSLLEGVRGKKNLVLEKSLAGQINLFVNFTTLQEYGVDKVFWLENGNVDSSQRNVVFLARGDTATKALAISEQVKKLQRESQVDNEFSVFWVPRRTLVGDKILEEEGVLGDMNIAEFPLYFLPLERDLLSLELDDSFSDLYLKRDPTAIFYSAKALMQLQQKHGLFPRITGKGDNGRKLADLLIRMRKELTAGEENSINSSIDLAPSSTIDNLIIIDREVDFGTVLLTQLTYEGLIDEVFGIKNNSTEVDSSIIGAAAQASVPSSQKPQVQGGAKSPTSTAPSVQQARKRKIQLDSSDKLFDQLRDTNFAIVGSLLNKVARRLESDYGGYQQAKSTAELREFVKKLPDYQAEQQSLKIHTGLAEDIMKHTRSDLFSRVLEVQQNLAAGSDPTSQHTTIEELIARDAPLSTVLRLLCLESCFVGGVRPKDLDNFKRLILHSYGFQHILTLEALEKLQLLQSRASANALMIPVTAVGAGSAVNGTKTNYTYLRKTLRLIVDEVNEQDPNDIAYVYSGYAPLSIRLVQCILQKQRLQSIMRGGNTNTAAGSVSGAAQGWRGFEDTAKHVRGATFDEAQSGEEKAAKARSLLSGSGEEKTTLIFFLGGITFTEIAALRFIAREEESKKRRIIMCTTSIINGNRMMQTAIEERPYGEATK